MKWQHYALIAILIVSIAVAAAMWNRKRKMTEFESDRLSENFTLAEFIETSTGIDNIPGHEEIESLRALVYYILQPLRTAVNKPVKVTSGYRSPLVNRMVGGAGNSQHTEGRAADIQIEGMTNAEIIAKIRELGLPYDQVIDEVKGSAEWVHVSYNPEDGNRGNWLTYRNGEYTLISKNYA